MTKISCLALALGVSAWTVATAAQDPLTQVLNAKGLSNIPTAAQNKATPGGYVAYDTENKSSPPSWFGLVKGEVIPSLNPTVDPVPIPKGTMNKIRGLDIELSLFGFHPLASFQSSTDLEYDQINLIPKGFVDPNAYFNDLLMPGTPLEKEMLEFGNDGNPRIWANQHLFVILTVFYSNGVSITSKSGQAIKLSSGKAVKDCTGLPVAQVPKAGAAAGAGAADGGGAAADVADAVTGGTPGGDGRFCRINDTHVEFHSEKPVPIAAELYRVEPLPNGKWNLLQRIVAFDGTKTTELKKN